MCIRNIVVYFKWNFYIIIKLFKYMIRIEIREKYRLNVLNNDENVLKGKKETQKIWQWIILYTHTALKFRHHGIKLKEGTYVLLLK